MAEPGTDVVRWADDAMYEAQEMLSTGEAGETTVEPLVFMLSGTRDPLGTCAADMRMYRGDPVYDLQSISDDDRRWAWEELSKTHLNTPLEGVSVKFMIEAVTRSFTHQMVRQRVGAYYVQESLRFAVKRGIANETALPPSLIPAAGNQDAAAVWQRTIEQIQGAYEMLVDAGIPAEDARGLLPHAVTTRIIYHTNLRALFEHAGNRLCTQAQFEWRKVFLGIMKALKEYDGGQYSIVKKESGGKQYFSHDNWQWQLIAKPKSHTFTPICYRLGKCAFESELDRGCSIRERVNLGQFDRIEPMEWMANPTAGMTKPEWGQARPNRSDGLRDDDPGH